MSHPFTALGVPVEMIQALEELGICNPTKTQEEVLPVLIKEGGDLIVQAQTGTGKTAAFGLPLLMKMDPGRKVIQGLVVAPTRELAKQIAKQLFRFTKHSTKIFVEVACGGDKIDKQEENLKRPTHIVVATPGRLLDLLARDALNLDSVKYLVLDEADEILSMGFKEELSKILSLANQRESTWLFSATFPPAIHALIDGCMSSRAPMIKIDQAVAVNLNIEHRFAFCKRGDKTAFILGFLKRHRDERGLIFTRTKAGAAALAKELKDAGLAVAVLQGDLMQKERDKVLRAFRKQRVQFVVATDVVARGIDVEGLAFVIHHQLPDQLDYYTHRSGRTARAGNKGMSLALIEANEKAAITEIENKLRISFSEYRK